MTNQSNVIELNGSHYDVLTGGPVESIDFSEQARGTSSTALSQPSQNSFGNYQQSAPSDASTSRGAFMPAPAAVSPVQTQPVAAPTASQTDSRPVETYDSARIYQHSTLPAAPAGYVQTAPAIPQAAPVVAPSAPAVPPITPFVPSRMTDRLAQAAPEVAAPAAQAVEAEVETAAKAAAKAAAPAVHRTVRASAKHAARHKPQSTRTLMRHAVKAPATTSHHTTHSSVKASSAPVAAKPDVSVRTTLAPAVHRTVATSQAHSVSPVRHQRSQAIVQSSMVERFRKQPLPREVASEATPAPAVAVAEQSQEERVAQQPQVARSNEPRPFSALEAAAAATAASRQLDVAAPAAAPAATKEEQRLWPSADRYLSRPRQEEEFDQEDDVELENIPEAAIPSLLDDNEVGMRETNAIDQLYAKSPERQQAQAAETARPLPPEPVSKFAKAPVKEDVFERALAVANGQQDQPIKQSKLQQPAKRAKKPRRLARWATSVAVLLVLVGAVAYQNRGSIQLQMASAKAGFAASAPGYKPSGFAMAKISYSPGTVATDYENDDKTFSVIQKKSTWDSQALLENFVATSNEAYQGYESNGRTIYVYGSGRATWVKDGIWYQIHADNVLSNEQLVKIAASM